MPWLLELDSLPADLTQVTAIAYSQTCRSTLGPPGFFLLSLKHAAPEELRRGMVALKQGISRLPFSAGALCGLLGVMHKGEIATPLPGRHRFINSTMLVALSGPEREPVGSEAQQAWIASGTSAGLG